MRQKELKLLGKILLGLICCVSIACRKELEKPSWDTEVLVPLIKTTLGIDNLLPDTIYRLESDSSITIVYNQKLDSFSLNVLDTIEVKPFTYGLKLAAIDLPLDTFIRKISLAEIARELIKSPDSLTQFSGYLILNNHGKTADFPNYNNLTAGPINIDVSKWFLDAKLTAGTLNIKMTNGLPITLSNMNLQLSNQTLQPSLLAESNFQNLLPGASQTQQSELAGKQVEGKLIARVPDMDLIGKKQIVIDTGAAFQLEVSISNLKVSEATAVFPQQSLITDQREFQLDIANEIFLKQVKVKTTNARIQVFSTIADTLYFNYSLPGIADVNGSAFKIQDFIPPSSAGNPMAAFDKRYSFVNHSMDLRGKPGNNKVNTLYSDLQARLGSGAKPIHLSASDSIFIIVSLYNVRPVYAQGALQLDTIIKGESLLTLFKDLTGNLNFEKVNARIVLDNGFGIPSTLTTSYIKASSSKGRQAILADNNVVGVPISIIPAVESNGIVQTRQTTISTSQLAPLLSILPDRFAYEFQLNAGSNPAESRYTDFIYDFSSFSASIEIDVPLAFQASNLTLTDTVAITPEFASAIRSGSLTLIARNGFPLRASLPMYFINDAGQVLDSLTTPEYVIEGKVDASTGKVNSKQTSKIRYAVSESKLQKIGSADKIIFKATFDTRPSERAVKIYRNYTIDFQLVGDVVYRVQ